MEVNITSNRGTVLERDLTFSTKGLKNIPTASQVHMSPRNSMNEKQNDIKSHNVTTQAKTMSRDMALGFPVLDMRNGLTYVALGCVLTYVLLSIKSGGVEVELSPGITTRRKVFVWIDVAIACCLFGYLVRFARSII